MPGIVTYVVDPRLSRFQVQAFAGGLLSALGHNPVIAIRNLAGDVSMHEGALDGNRADSKTLQDASVTFRVDAGSLQLKDDVAERDRREIERNMRQEVLESDRFPEITFAANRVEVVDRGTPTSVNLDGSLTLHGQTRTQSIPAKVTVNNGSMRAFGEFTLRQTDYNIRLVTFAAGALKIKDEVKLTFDLIARRLPNPAAEEGS
jgi:polyisoprenoid-binding protein YceI